MGFLDENASNLKVADFIIRLLVIPFSISAFYLTINNYQNDSSYGTLDYSNLVGLKYMVCINGISAGYALLAAVSLWVRCLVSQACIFFVSDQIMTYLMVSSMAATADILYLAYNGDERVSWSEACTTFGVFCSRLKLALGLHVIALCCFLLLSLISAFRLFTRFNPPFIPSNQGTETEQQR